MYSITSKNLNNIQFTHIRNKKRTIKNTTVRASKGNDLGINLKYVEAVNGRAATYGTILGTLNWGITGLNVIEQSQFMPLAILGCGTSLLAIGTLTDAVRELSDEEFDKFATINTGRVSMVLFTGLVGAAIAGV
tara:strand:+ start:2603 stop:3004 length:402 start_codon:yes stop_codon:yes gene_type:complete